MGIFSGLEKLGLGRYENAKVIEEKKNMQDANKSANTVEPEKTKEEIELDALFDKSIVCPVCDIKFSIKCIRAGKVRLEGKDTDLRPIYKDIDPIKYDVIACDNCGYAALTRYFGRLANRQIKDINEQIGANFSGIVHENDLYTYDDAIMRYKLALVTSLVKHAKNSEKGYICLKYGWVLRGKRLSLDKGDGQIKSLYAQEMECLSNAYECFKLALASEDFPIAGMDENTLQYVMADLARRLHKYDDSQRLLGNVIASKTVSHRLKDQALLLKDILKEDIKKNS